MQMNMDMSVLWRTLNVRDYKEYGGVFLTTLRNFWKFLIVFYFFIAQKSALICLKFHSAVDFDSKPYSIFESDMNNKISI